MRMKEEIIHFITKTKTTHPHLATLVEDVYNLISTTLSGSDQYIKYGGIMYSYSEAVC